MHVVFFETYQYVSSLIAMVSVALIFRNWLWKIIDGETNDLQYGSAPSYLQDISTVKYYLQDHMNWRGEGIRVSQCSVFRG
jgi:hypothetical protein